MAGGLGWQVVALPSIFQVAKAKMKCLQDRDEWSGFSLICLAKNHSPSVAFCSWIDDGWHSTFAWTFLLTNNAADKDEEAEGKQQATTADGKQQAATAAGSAVVSSDLQCNCGFGDFGM